MNIISAALSAQIPAPWFLGVVLCAGCPLCFRHASSPTPRLLLKDQNPGSAPERTLFSLRMGPGNRGQTHHPELPASSRWSDRLSKPILPKTPREVHDGFYSGGIIWRRDISQVHGDMGHDRSPLSDHPISIISHSEPFLAPAFWGTFHALPCGPGPPGLSRQGRVAMNALSQNASEFRGGFLPEAVRPPIP